MANLKLSQLSQSNSVANTDLINISQDQGGLDYTNGSRKVAFIDLKNNAQKKSPISVSNTYSISANTDGVILANSDSTSFTITLPSASTASEKHYIIKKVNSSTNAITVDGDGSETIDGSLTKVITAQYTSLTLYSDGSEWFII